MDDDWQGLRRDRRGAWQVCAVAGWGGFAAWALVGALLSLSVLGAASIGLFVLPVALLAAVTVGWTMRIWPEIAGALEGIAALSLFVGLGNLGSRPCPSSGSHTSSDTSGSSFTCGGFDPRPWLVIGVVLAGAGLAVYLFARGHVTERPAGPSRGAWGVVVVAGFLLVTMGVAIVAAPLTLPLLFRAVKRHHRRAFRTAAAVVGGLTAAELAWALVYFVAGETPVAIWLLPTASALATATALLTVRQHPAGD